MDKSRKLKPEEIATILGVTRATVYTYKENGTLSGFTCNGVANYIQIKQLQVDKMTRIFEEVRR